MSEKEKDFAEKEESFEEIFSNLREKYNLQPFGSDEKPVQEEEKVFYNPAEDSEIEDFFKSREEDYTALYEEVDAKMAGVDDEALQKEAEVFNLEFKKDKALEESSPENIVYEDISSGRYDEETEEETTEDEVEAKEDISDESDDQPATVMLTLDDEPATVALTPPADGGIPEDISVDKVNTESTDAQKAKEILETSEEPQQDVPVKKKNSAGDVIRKIIFVISIIALIGSAAWLINDYFIQPYLIEKRNNEIADVIDAETEDPNKVIEKLDNLKGEEKALTFEKLKKMNPDFNSWIVFPGADISLPVVKCKDNSKYLRKSFDGKYSVGGTAFIDCYNGAPFSDRNTVIYGHHMRDGSMFGKIKNYKKEEAFKKNPLIYVYTENESYVYKIYGVFLSNANVKDDNGYVFGYTFKNVSTEENFAAFMEEVRLRSYYNTGVEYEAGDKILTLSTCDKTEMKNGRLVVVARLLREGESKEIDTTLVRKNNNQKFPEAWYARNKRTNPYKDSAKWYAQ